MLQIRTTTLFIVAALTVAGCQRRSETTPVLPELADEVRSSAQTYREEGSARQKKEYASVEDVTVPLADGYVLKVFDVRALTMPIANFRGPDIGLHPPNPFFHAPRTYRDNDYDDLGQAFEPYNGMSHPSHRFLDFDTYQSPYLQEGLDYDDAPYDNAKGLLEQLLINTVVNQVGGRSWTNDAGASIGYYSGLLVVRQKEEIMWEVATLINLLRASPGR